LFFSSPQVTCGSAALVNGRVLAMQGSRPLPYPAFRAKFVFISQHRH
jgi:hypothetical protein